MVKKKLILKESELVSLINSTVKTIQEQNMVPTDLDGGGGGITYYTSDGKIITNPTYIKYQQKLADDALNRSLGNSYRKTAKEICDKILTGKDLTDRETEILNGTRYMSEQIMDCLQDNQPDLNNTYGYHNVLMVLAIVGYIISAIGTIFAWTGVGAIVAEAALIIATLIEFADGLGYILDDEPDYFMAGITWVFMIVYPAAQLGKNVFKPITSKLSKIIRQSAKFGFKGVHTAFGKLTRAEKLIMRKLFEDYPKLKSGINLATKKLNHDIKIIRATIKGLKGKPGMGYAVRQLEWIIKNILKPIKVGVKLIANLTIMLSVWDPQLASGGFTWLGEKTGWDSFGSLASLFDKWAKSGIHGQSAYKAMLDWYGNPRAVITTTPKDCSMEVYDWLDTKIKYKKEFNTKPGLSETEIVNEMWEEWQKGWRPGTTIEDVDSLLSMELALLNYERFRNLLVGNTKTLTNLGFTNEEVDSWNKVLGSCEDYLKAIETENEDLQDAMTYLHMFEDKLK